MFSGQAKRLQKPDVKYNMGCANSWLFYHSFPPDFLQRVSSFFQILFRSGTSLFLQTLEYFQRMEIPDNLNENPTVSAYDQFKQQTQTKEMPCFASPREPFLIHQTLEGKIHDFVPFKLQFGTLIILEYRGMLQALCLRDC